jgi:hypothetical protein
VNSGVRQCRTGAVDGGTGVDEGAGRDVAEPVVTGATEDAAAEDSPAGDLDTGAGAAASTGAPPHPASTGTEIANHEQSILRRIFPPPPPFRQNEAEP